MMTQNRNYYSGKTNQLQTETGDSYCVAFIIIIIISQDHHNNNNNKKHVMSQALISYSRNKQWLAQNTRPDREL